MTSSLKGKKILPILVFILFTLVIISSAFTFSTVAKASTVKDGEIKVAQISDIHYFPRDLCPDKYAGTHFEMENNQDFKLVAESGTMLNAALDNIFNEAKTNGLDVLIVSGDNTKDGEKRAHIDLANRLRMLQNDIRTFNPNFQILVLPGNHDLYNSDGNRYNVVIDTVTGEKKNYYVDSYGKLEKKFITNADGKVDTAYFVTDSYGNRIKDGSNYKTEINNNALTFGYEQIAETSQDEFMKIYSGLGYPDFSIEEVAKYSDLTKSPEVAYSPNKENEYFFNTPYLHFVDSKNSTKFNFKYFNDKFNTGSNKTIKDYAADYTIDYIGLNKSSATTLNDKINLINTNEDAKTLFKNLYNLGRSSYIAIPNDSTSNLYGFDFAMIDSNLSEVKNGKYLGLEHKTGGKILDHTMNWVADNLTEEKARQDTIISSFHHGSVPHFPAQEVFMNDFVLYNWEDAVVKLTNAGIRYSMTGHVHATDIVSYVADNGKTITDIVTGSIISYGSPIRYMNFNRTSAVNTVTDEVYTVNSFKGVPSKYVVEKDKHLSDYTIDKDPGYEVSKNFGKDATVNYLENVQGYIYNKTMDTIIPTMMSGFINKEVIASMTEAIPDSNLKALVDSLISQLANNFRPLDLEGNEKALFDYIYSAVLKVMDECKNDANHPIDINEVMRNTYTKYIINGEVTKVEDSAIIKAVKDAALDGTLAKMILGTSTNERGLLYPILFADNNLIGQLLDFKFDFSQTNLGLSAEKVAIALFNMFGVKLSDETGYLFSINDLLDNATKMLDPLSSEAGIMGDVLRELNKGKSAVAVLRTYADSYLNDKFYKNTGKILFDVVTSFGVQENKFGKELNLLGGKVSNGIIPSLVENDIKESEFVKRGFVPSMFALTYGKDATKEMNLVWNTASFMNSTITVVDNATSKVLPAEKVTFEKVTIPYGYPIFDVGFLSKLSIDSFKEQHKQIMATGWDKSTKLRTIYTLKVKDLEPNKKYKYTITTNPSAEYSNISSIAGFNNTVEGYFTTAKAEGPVTFVGLAGMQGSTLDNYTDVNTNVNSAIAKAGNVDFIVNVGGMVDNAKNIKQWAYMLNSVEAFSKYPTIIVAGSKDKALHNYFEIANANIIDTDDKWVQKDNDKVLKSAESGAYYSYNISNVKVIVLNTNSLTADGIDELQLKWLKQELKDNKATWTVVVMNNGMYTNGPHSKDNSTIALQKQLTALFYDNNVDIVLQANDKALTTSKFLDRNGKPAANTSTAITSDNITYDKPAGVLYLTVGSIVDNYYKVAETDIVDNTRSLLDATKPTYAIFKVDSNILNITLGSTDTATANSLQKLTIKKERAAGTDTTVSSMKIKDINSEYSVDVDLANTETRYTVSNGFSVKDLVFTKPTNSTWRNWKFYSKQKPMGLEEYVELAPTAVLASGNNDIKMVVTSESGETAEYFVKLYVENRAETIFGNLLYIGGEKKENGFCFKNLSRSDVISLDLISSPDVTITSEGFTQYQDKKTGEFKDTNTYRYEFTYKGNNYTLDHDNYNLYEGTTWMKYKLYDADGKLMTTLNYSAETPKDNTKMIVIIVVVVVLVLLIIINLILKKTKGKSMFSFLNKFKKNKPKYYVD